MIGLLSYPKSGSTLIRYIFEQITNRSTLHLIRERSRSVSSIVNKDVVDHKKPAAILKKHYVDPELKKCQFLILLIRDYTEVIPSYIYSRRKNKNKKLTYKNFIKTFNPAGAKNHMLNYCRNIRYYDRWVKPKAIINYNDLVLEPVKVIKDIHKILGNAYPEKVNQLINNYEYHKESVLKFKKYKSGLQLNTSGDLFFFSRLLNKNKKKGLNDLYMRCYLKLGMKHER